MLAGNVFILDLLLASFLLRLLRAPSTRRIYRRPKSALNFVLVGEY